MNGQIARQSESYRRGLVLGLTMAEILMLLVFCLMMAASAALRHGQKERQALEQQLTVLRESAVDDYEQIGRAVAELAMRDKNTAQTLQDKPINPSTITDLWRDLVASQELGRQFEQSGLSIKDAQKRVQLFVDTATLLPEGADLRSLIRKAELADRVSDVQKALNMDPNDVAALARVLADGLRSGTSADSNSQGHQWPPIISLSEADGYFFALGSAELTSEFQRRLAETVVPSLAQLSNQYSVNVIEVVGHTDELPMGGRPSNLDRDLIEVLRGSKPISALKAADNAGLGLARSVSVVRSILQDPRLAGMRILPLSGAQLIKTDEALADGSNSGDVKERRRIEIRLRKSN